MCGVMKNRISLFCRVVSLRLKRLPRIGIEARPGVRCRVVAFGVGQHATHDGRAAIWNQHFSLHALSVDTRNAANGDAGIDRVVFDRDAKNDRADIGDLRRD